MDIELPCLDEQAAPAPWLVNRARIDVRAAAHDAAGRMPGASVDELVAEMRSHGVQASAIVVAMDQFSRSTTELDASEAVRHDDARREDRLIADSEAAIDEAARESFPASDRRHRGSSDGSTARE